MKSTKNSLLWQLQKKDGFGSSFVFGTMHIRHLNIIKSQIAVFEKLQSCDAFACEFNLEERQNMHTDHTHLNLPDGKSIKEFITEKQYFKLQKIIKKASKIELDHFQHFQPIFITNLLTESILRKDSPYSLDEFLWNYAIAEGKEMLGIETIEAQMAILKKIDLKFQINSLLTIGKNYKNFRHNTLKLNELYLKGDIHQLHQSTKKGIGKMRKILLYDRNEHMANRIDAIASQKSFFCAIGAGHLSGKKGVLRLLKLKGWKVSPVKK